MAQNYSITLNKKHFDAIEHILNDELIALGVHSLILIDMAGNIIVNMENDGSKHDIYSLAALAAGNLGAVNAMANIIGEQEFDLLFHKGERDSIHFSKVMNDLILVTVFGKDVSLGFLRLKIAAASEKMRQCLQI